MNLQYSKYMFATVATCTVSNKILICLFKKISCAFIFFSFAKKTFYLVLLKIYKCQPFEGVLEPRKIYFYVPKIHPTHPSIKNV